MSSIHNKNYLKVTYKGKEIKLPNITSSQASGSALNDTKNTNKLNQRNKNEDIAQELLNNIVEFYSGVFKDPSQNFDNIEILSINVGRNVNENTINVSINYKIPNTGINDELELNFG